MENKRAFTLAEVLVTLMIIGVIAAITIPSLRKSAGDREIIAGTKKAYSTVSQAILLAENDNGPIRRWGLIDGTDAGVMDAYEKVKPYFNIARYCGASEKGCWAKQAYKLDGTLIGSDLACYGDNCVAFSTADGVNYSIDIGGASAYGITTAGMNMAFIVDVNGDKKPNMMGIDMQYFNATSDKGVVPGGLDDTSKCIAKTNGLTCTAILLKENKFTY